MATENKKKKRLSWMNLFQLLTLAVFLGWVQFAVKTGRISKIFLAAPTDIVKELFSTMSKGILAPHLVVTLQEVFAGYLLAGVVGVSLGLLWTLFPKLESYMNVFCAAIMAVPKTAILPLLILWFGIGFQSKVVLIFLFSVFQILYNTVTGAKQCKTEYLKVARVFEANRLQTVFRVVIPSALPSMFNGFRLAAATALTGVVFSEMQSAKAGLGYLLAEAQQLLNTSRMFLVIILVTLISVCLVKLVSIIEYIFCHRWRRV